MALIVQRVGVVPTPQGCGKVISPRKPPPPWLAQGFLTLGPSEMTVPPSLWMFGGCWWPPGRDMAQREGGSTFLPPSTGFPNP